MPARNCNATSVLVTGKARFDNARDSSGRLRIFGWVTVFAALLLSPITPHVFAQAGQTSATAPGESAHVEQPR